jgi:hypothetical protein
MGTKKIRRTFQTNGRIPKTPLGGKMNKFSSKAAKLRIKPGSFVKEKRTGDIYCIRYCYRLQTDPHNWFFYLEERTNLKSPSTTLSVLLTGKIESDSITDYFAYKNHHEAQERVEKQFLGGMYRFGNSIIMENKKLLNNSRLL